MRIVFGLHLDGLNPAAPRSSAGETALGPRGLLQVLETQLGLPTPNTHPSEAPFSYLQCLREATTPDRFFHRSLEIDPINVARTLLDWRAQWHEAGWDGTFPEDVPARLTDMAAVETIARHRVPPTPGERLQRVAEALAERQTQIEQIELHTPVEDLPHVWQQVLRALPCIPAPGLELAVAAPEGSDLAQVQSRLLSMIDHDDDSAVGREILQGDGSLVVVKSASRTSLRTRSLNSCWKPGGLAGRSWSPRLTGSCWTTRLNARDCRGAVFNTTRVFGRPRKY